MTICTWNRPFTAGSILTAALVGLMVLPLTARGQDEGVGDKHPVKTIYEPAAVPDLENIPTAGISRNFRLVAHTDLGRAGADNNANSLGFIDDCIYIGTRNDARGVLIVDATSLDIITELDPVDGSNSQEYRTVSDLDLLVVMGFAARGSDETVGVNILQVYDTSFGCSTPNLQSTFDFGAGKPHEFFLWRDPVNVSRVLAYQTISGETASGGEYPNLRVIDVSNKAAPTLVATFDLRDFGVPRNEPPSEENGNESQNNGLHSLSVSDDGTRVYLAHNDAGFLILDSTPLAFQESCNLSHKRKSPCLQLVNPDTLARLDFKPPGPGKTHSAVKVPGKDLIVLTHEFFGSGECPWGWVRIVDVRFEPQPKQISTFLLPENMVENCPIIGPQALDTRSDYTSHNPTPLENLLFVSWRGAGTRAIDISNPFMPHEAGFYFPQTAVRVADGELARIHMASYPVIKDGLIYVLDRYNGLFVLEYSGQFQEEVSAIAGPCMGNASPILDIGSLQGTCSPPAP